MPDLSGFSIFSAREQASSYKEVIGMGIIAWILLGLIAVRSRRRFCPEMILAGSSSRC